MYIVTATVNGKQTPTFLLDPNIQGIINEAYAVVIAMNILNPWGDPSLDISICAVLV